jgi:hypothetical protein
MALCYIAHAYGGDKKNIERAKRITRGLQKQDLANCYICPLMAFSHLEYGEIGYDDEMELCLDLLTCADKLIVASEISSGVRKEIDFAKLVKMEVLIFEENGELRPFTE